jgi:group I intron endonuclease
MPTAFTIENLRALKSACGIYAIIGPERVYVGQSAATKARLHEHFTTLTVGRHKNCILQRSWLKNGPNAFTFAILETIERGDSTKEELKKRLSPLEQKWTDYYRAQGYELCALTPIVDSTLGFKFNEEQRAHLKVKRKGRKPALGMVMADDHKAAIIAANTGRKKSAEEAAKISAAHKGKPKSSEHRANLSAAKTGIPQSADSNQKRAETLARRKAEGLPVGRPKGSPVSEAERKIRAESFRGRKHSEETKLKMAAARRRYYEERKHENDL